MILTKNGLHKHERTWECYATLPCFFVLAENFRQQPSAETGSCEHFHAETLALPARAQSSSVHFTHTFPSSSTPEWKKGPVLPHCTDLCLCLANHIISWDRGCFLGQNVQHGGSHGLLWCLAGPSPPFISVAALWKKAAEKGLYVFVVVHLQKGSRSQINTDWVIAQHVSPAR